MHNKEVAQCPEQKSREIFAPSSLRVPCEKCRNCFIYLSKINLITTLAGETEGRRSWKRFCFIYFSCFTFKLNFANCWALNSRSAREADEVHRSEPTDCAINAHSNRLLLRRVPEERRWLISLPRVILHQNRLPASGLTPTTGIINLQSDEHSSSSPRFQP